MVVERKVGLQYIAARRMRIEAPAKQSHRIFQLCCHVRRPRSELGNGTDLPFLLTFLGAEGVDFFRAIFDSRQQNSDHVVSRHDAFHRYAILDEYQCLEDSL
jgi:hypothetical protein